MHLNVQYTLYGLNILIFGFLFWNVFKDIKNAEGEKRHQKFLIYGGILAVCVILFLVLRIYFSEQMDWLYWKLSG
jgi:uncharacterized membrane protein